MIKNFSIENFQSIKEEVNVSFVASALTDETMFTNYFDFKDEKILKVLAFYGMNASGKSTIVRALAALRELVIPYYQPAPGSILINPVLPYYPFKFSNETRNSVTSMKIEFSPDNSNDSSVFRYSVSYNGVRIYQEKLEKLTSQKYSLVYLRETKENNQSSISFGNIVSNIQLLEALKGSLVPNRTFLSLFSSFKVADFVDAYYFFERMVNISPEVTRFDDLVPNEIENNEKLSEFIVKLLKAADFNIDAFHVSKSKRSIQNLPGLVAEKKSLFLDHNVEYDDKSIEFIQESLGTKKIIVIGMHLFNALSKPSTMIVDELEASLHPELTKLIVTLFLDESVNTHNSQLIFTSHETTLLDLDLLRRDEIYFVYKKRDTGATYINPLKDFSMRKDSSISKSYLSGRFSTSPNVNENEMIGVN